VSWDDDRIDEKTCPCGKGRYTVTYRSNDWGQHDEHWAMRCTRCNATHGLYNHSYMDRKGMHAVDFWWVPKQHLRELEDLGRAIRKHKDELETYLRNQYGGRWIRHFEGGSKKATWAELTHDGQDYPQLSTFYNHVRLGGLEVVLNSYLRYDTVHVVRRTLGLDDSELSSRVERIADLESDAAVKESQIRAIGVR
jgi:hypothetical protein